MFHDREEELNRLEEALLEQEDEPAENVEETKVLGSLEDFFEEEDLPPVQEDVTAYSNLPSDVDLEDFSEDVYAGKKDPLSGLSIFFLVVTTLLFCFLLYILLWYKGVFS